MAEILEILGLALIPLFLVLDLVHRARKFAAPRGWRLYGLAVGAVAFLVSVGVTVFWARLIGERTLLDLRALGTVPGALVGILVYELAHYLYHRAAHKWNWLWRAGHQMHHSAESLDAFGAYYMHPLDAAMFTTLSALVLFPFLGLSAEAGALVAVFLTFNAMFQHANIRTPRWVGYVVQRPESHGVHHARGVHAHNYSDLPLWDMVFGTFRNPEHFEAECGFEPGASRRIPEMLVGLDVSREAQVEPENSPAMPVTQGAN